VKRLIFNWNGLKEEFRDDIWSMYEGSILDTMDDYGDTVQEFDIRCAGWGKQYVAMSITPTVKEIERLFGEARVVRSTGTVMEIPLRARVSKGAVDTLKKWDKDLFTSGHYGELVVMGKYPWPSKEMATKLGYKIVKNILVRKAWK